MAISFTEIIGSLEIDILAIIEYYHLFMTNIAMENDPFIDGLLVYLLKMVIFYGYVK